MAASIVALPKRQTSTLKPPRARPCAYPGGPGDWLRGALRDALLHSAELAASDNRRELIELQYAHLPAGQQLVDPKRPGFLARASKSGIRYVCRYNGPMDSRRSSRPASRAGYSAS
jgi:hypothetical protein